MIFPNMLSVYFIFFCMYLRYSTQDLHNLALQQGLNYDEAEELLGYEKKDGVKRQATFKTKGGIQQNKICGINGQSSSRSRRQDGFTDDAPQGSQDWPWLALLLTTSQIPFCGGVLLDSRYILTAAHCFHLDNKHLTKDDVFLRLGEYDVIDSDETQKQLFTIDEIIEHPRYDEGNYENDIALIKLNDTVKYTQYVRPICLPNAEPQVNETTIVAGWGKIEENGEKSKVLLYVDVPVWDREQCDEALDGTGNPLHSTNICAAGYEGGKDSCQGDSGGPLMYQENGKRWVNVGVVSWGKGCASIYPGVYTSVIKYLSWIAKYISDASP